MGDLSGTLTDQNVDVNIVSGRSSDKSLLVQSMKIASKDRRRVSANALITSNELYDTTQGTQYPEQDITGETVSRNIPWVGPQMATWRITGYVADSEGEDDEIDFSFAQHGVSCTGQRHDITNGEQAFARTKVIVDGNNDARSWPTPTLADRLDTAECIIHQEHTSTSPKLNTNTDQPLKEVSSQIQCPLPTVSSEHTTTKDVPSPLRAIQNSIFDDLDSPLSTPPDSPVPIPVHAPSRSEDYLESDLPAPSTYAASRNFRPRKAIQINPYLLDYAKHQKEWGERGLKPVHIPRAASPQRREHGAESPEFASRDDSQASANMGQESMTLDEASTMNEIESFDFDGGLPDLEVLLRQNVNNRQQQVRSKKRARRSPGRISSQTSVFDLPSSNDENQQRKKTRRQLSLPQHDSIPSPPRSGSLSVHDQLPSTLSDASESPKPLTPAASTGLRSHRWRHVIEDDSQSQNEDVGTFVNISSSEGSDSGSETESESEGVRLLQKRLRGVIPASYLTVQKVQQAILQRRHEAANATANPTAGPGVAQRRLSKVPHRTSLEETTLRLYEDLVSEEEDSQEEPVEHAAVDVTAESGSVEDPDIRLRSYEDAEASETMDDAGIDQMLPARPRGQNVRRGQQTKSLHGTGKSDEHKERRHHRQDATRRATKSRSRREPRASRRVIHVLDAPGLSPNNVTKPHWLRLAARRARRTKAAGKSAAQKVFQLHTPGETAAALKGVMNRAHAPDARRDKVVTKNAKVMAPRKTDKRASSDPSTPSKLDNHQILQWPLLRAPEKGTRPSHLQQDNPGVIAEQDSTAPTRPSQLKSLLPLKNRSGLGRLIYRRTEPRFAQIEEVQQSYRGLSRVSLQKPSVFPPLRGPHIAEPGHATTILEPGGESTCLEILQPRSDAPSANPIQGPKRSRKQTPVYRPRVQQSLLAPLKLHTEKLYALIGQTGAIIRSELEREFVAHQAEWFQGRKEGIVCANEATQKHFQVFLEVLNSHLVAVSNAASDAGDSRGLRSFTYRLVPNRGSIGAQGQVGYKSMDVLDFDILVARNVFDLHVCLLNLAPAYAPLPRVLETKVDFTDAHDEICLIALSAWQAICNHHHTQHFITDGLSGWLHLILSQLLSRWKSAESDARAEAEHSIQRIEERVIRKVIEHNRAQASKLLIVTLSRMLQGVEDAVDSTEATSLLSLDRYIEFVAALMKLPHIDSDVYAATFKVASSYAEQWLGQSPSNILPLLSSLRQAISALTSHVVTFVSETQRCMIRAFFLAARIAVKKRQKSWDDFFAPTSSFSLNMFVSEKHVDSSKALFYQQLLDNEPDAYLLEFRGLVLSHWLRILIQLQDDEARVGLTRSVFSHEKDSLAMPSLVATFLAPESTIPVTTIRDNISEIRHATILHVIAELSGQDKNAEAEWLPGGLDESDAVQLLKTIFSTMKQTWMSLSEQPEQQDEYTLLIHAALDQYEVHSRSDFAVEAWFYNPVMIPQRRKRSLAKILAQYQLSDIDFIQDAMDVMQQEILHANRFSKFDDLADELKSLLLPSTTEWVVTPQQDRRNSVVSRHLLFMQDVLLPLIKRDERSSDLVLEVMNHITSSLECRVPIHDDDVLQTLVNLFTVAIEGFSETLATRATDARAKVYTLTLVAFELRMMAGFVLPEEFMDKVGQICELAIQDELTEGITLVEAVVSRF